MIFGKNWDRVVVFGLVCVFKFTWSLCHCSTLCVSLKVMGSRVWSSKDVASILANVCKGQTPVTVKETRALLRMHRCISLAEDNKGSNFQIFMCKGCL